MTIKTRAQLYCDIGLKCTKQIVKTAEGPAAGRAIRDWAIGQGWCSYGQRDACPECWKALHSPTAMEAIEGAREGAREALRWDETCTDDKALDPPINRTAKP